jgi:hypothetical protein
MKVRCKEHMRYMCLGQPEKSTVAEHRFETGHNNFSSTSTLGKVTGSMDHIIKEATEIRLHPRNFNSDRSFTLSQFWYTMTNILKQYRDTPIQKQGQAKQALDSAH